MGKLDDNDYNTLTTIIKEEYKQHRLGCNMQRECWSNCEECMVQDTMKRIRDEIGDIEEASV